MCHPFPNADFYNELIRCINNARKTIIIVNYVAELLRREKGNPVYDLCRGLVMAKRRGVKIDIILEGSKFEQSYPFFRYLKDNGIDCWLDTSETFIHQKTVLIDGGYLIAGSHNLSMTSLMTNVEFALATSSRRCVRKFMATFKIMTRQRDSIRASICRDTIDIPASFLILGDGEGLSGAATQLLTKHGKNLFDLYMALCFEDGGTPRPLSVDYRRWGEMMGLDPCSISGRTTKDYRDRFYYRRVGDTLEKLEAVFGLISRNKGNDTVERQPLPAHPVSIKVPLTFWKFGWNRRLSFASKYFYLLSLSETPTSPSRPWWRLSNREIKAKYGISDSPLEIALPELEAYKLLEVMRAAPKKIGSRYSQEANYYRHNPFYAIL